MHQNYVGSDVDKIPFFLSVVLTDANHQCVPQYRAILWRKTVILFSFIYLLYVILVNSHTVVSENKNLMVDKH